MRGPIHIIPLTEETKPRQMNKAITFAPASPKMWAPEMTATFQNAVNYVQFSLTLCSTLTVLGVFVLRWRQPDLPRPYRTWGYPVTPAIFLLVSVWMLEHMLSDPSTRTPSLWGLATMALGLAVYFLSAKRSPASV